MNEDIMTTMSLRILSVLVLLLGLSPAPIAGRASQQSEKDGTLIVLVTWGDDNNTLANDVYIEAHGFVHKYDSQKSFVLTSSKAGRYEASLPPAVYDVFVSEGTSEPRCRRVRVRGGLPTTWTLRLEIDEVYTVR
jgi:hypothetical protein